MVTYGGMSLKPVTVGTVCVINLSLIMQAFIYSFPCYRVFSFSRTFILLVTGTPSGWSPTCRVSQE